MGDWINTFFIPIIQIGFVTIFTLVISFFVARGFYAKWIYEWKFILKYDIQGSPYKQEEIANLLELENIPIPKIKMELLVNGISEDKINELIFLHKRIFSKPVQKKRIFPKINLKIRKEVKK